MAVDTETAFSFELPNGDVRTALVVARYENVSEIVVFLANGDYPMYDNSGEPTRTPHFIVANDLTPTEVFAPDTQVTGTATTGSTTDLAQG